MNNLGKSLINIEEKIFTLGSFLTKQTEELDSRGVKWFNYDDKKEQMIKQGADKKIIKFNIGGKIYQCTLLTILNNPDCLFFNLIMSGDWNIEEELFFDRSFKYFPIILSYLRNKIVSLEDYRDEQMPDISIEAKYYCIQSLIDITEKYASKTVLVSFEFSGQYLSGTTVVGTNDINDLNDIEDRSCMKGVVTGSPGWIIFKLNKETEVAEIEIGGYRGNTNLFACSNGSGASIMTSTDKTSWVDVGTINSLYANDVYLHSVTPSKAKYIKLNYSSYIGVGYFRVLK